MQERLFTALNVKILVGALAVIALGYWLVGRGPVTNSLSMSVAPIVMVIGYCVMIPAAIMVRGKSVKKDDN